MGVKDAGVQRKRYHSIKPSNTKISDENWLRCCLAASQSQIMDEIDFFVEKEIFQSKVINERS